MKSYSGGDKYWNSISLKTYQKFELNEDKPLKSSIMEILINKWFPISKNKPNQIHLIFEKREKEKQT